MVKCTEDCGYTSPKDMDVCPRCGKAFGIGDTSRAPKTARKK